MKYLTIAATALALSAGAASAATIIDTTAGAFGGLTIGQNGNGKSLGQTFTLSSATENLVAGGHLIDINDFLNPTFEVTISIHAGNTLGAPILGSQTFTLADGFIGLQTADFSGLGTLSAGVYSLGFSAATNRGMLRFATSDSPSTDTLNGNGLFTTGNGYDFAVLVTGDAVNSPAPVPLPAGFPLLAAGLIGLGVLARRKKAA